MRLPDWLKTKYNPSSLRDVKSLLREHGLTTVCEEARCPNKPECFKKPTAAFMILGSKCTRNCGFCSVRTFDAFKENGNNGFNGKLPPPSDDEPERVALAAEFMSLRHVVITSVTRDDLPDGGACHFAKTVKAVKGRLPHSRVEVLTPDFQGNPDAVKTVLSAGPDIFNHNLETVPALYPKVRPRADYRRSLDVLRTAGITAPEVVTKSGLMLGLGETLDEVREVFADLREAGCGYLTLGQYLRPSKSCLPVVKYVEPSVFKDLEKEAVGMGFKWVSSAPLVRSSMNAEEVFSKGERT